VRGPRDSPVNDGTLAAGFLQPVMLEMLLCSQLMESAQLTGDQKAELQRQRQDYLCHVAELARERAPYEVSNYQKCHDSGFRTRVVLRSVLSACTVRSQYAMHEVTGIVLLLTAFDPVHGKVLILVQQAQLPGSGSGDNAGGGVASSSWFDATAALPRIATSVIKFGRLLQQEQTLFLRVRVLKSAL
jgi:hypothetical protein